jgi:uncharacterized protein Smg (DUF494 family)
MMHLLSLIAGQVRTRQQLFSDEGRIMDSLTNSGFRLQEADAALTLMQSLAQGTGGLACMRVMSTEERRRFSVDAFGLVSKLAVLGIVTEDQRERIIEKALASHGERIGFDEVRTLLALDLFGGDPDPEGSDPLMRDRRGTVWN